MNVGRMLEGSCGAGNIAGNEVAGYNGFKNFFRDRIEDSRRKNDTLGGEGKKFKF